MTPAESRIFWRFVKEIERRGGPADPLEERAIVVALNLVREAREHVAAFLVQP